MIFGNINHLYFSQPPVGGWKMSVSICVRRAIAGDPKKIKNNKLTTHFVRHTQTKAGQKNSSLPDSAGKKLQQDIQDWERLFQVFPGPFQPPVGGWKMSVTVCVRRAIAGG